MISFRCSHCATLVRVAKTHVGKKGRCPECKGFIRIPLKSEGDGDTCKQAATDHDGDCAVGEWQGALEDEVNAFELADMETKSACDTDTFPAITESKPAETPRPQAPPRPVKSHSKNRLKPALIAAVIAIILAAAAAAWWLYLR